MVEGASSRLTVPFVSSEEPAILAQGEIRPNQSQLRCCACGRADQPEGSLQLCSLARDGVLLRVCRLCYLFAEVRDLSTGGGVSPFLLQQIDSILENLFRLLRAELDSSEDGGSQR